MAIKKDLSTLGLPGGTHTITVRARAEGFIDSADSNAVTYTLKEKLALPNFSIQQNQLHITDPSGKASSFNIYLNGTYAAFVNKAKSGDTVYPLYKLALDRVQYRIGVRAIPASGTPYLESDLATVTFTYANTGHSVKISNYFDYTHNITLTFYLTNGTTNTKTLSQLYQGYRGQTFTGVYKVTGTYAYSSWFCYFYVGPDGSTGRYPTYYLEPAGGKTDAAMNIEWDCVMDSETPQDCITADSLVTMADGTTKTLEDVRVGDFILSYDWNTMQLVPNKVIFSAAQEPNWDKWYCNRYYKWTFSDGTVIKNCFSHRFYNKEAKAFIYLEYWRIGDHTYKMDGTNPYLVSQELVTERVRYGRITGENGTNYFANGLLTGDRHCPKDIILP